MGLIPREWEVGKIGELARITTGSKNTQDRVLDGAYPFFVRSQQVERINSYSYDGEAVLTAGDGVGTGKVFHYIVGKFDVHQRVYRISDFKGRLDGRYFYYQFSTRFLNRVLSMTAKSSVDSVRMDMISDMEIPVPPLIEQRAIASALSDVDALIGALADLIAKKRAVKLGAEEKLLTGRTRLPGFVGKWKDMMLGELGHFFKGRGIKSDEITDIGLPCVRYGELYTRYRNYVTTAASRVSPAIAAQSIPILRGDILFAGSGETAEDIATCAAYLGDEKAYAGGDIIVHRPIGQDPVFLAHLLNSPPVRAQKARLCHGEMIVHTNPRSLGMLQFQVPDLMEQRAISSVLLDIDAEVAALEERRGKMQTIKQGMMQSLLSGRARLARSGKGAAG